MGFLVIFLITVVIALAQMSLIYPLPFSDTGTVRYRTIPYMTFALIIANCAIFMAWQAIPLYRAETIPELQPYVDQIWTFGYRGVFMREGLSVGAFVTFTSMFMHADFFHLFGNMIYLWTFGRRVEDACGHWRFLLYYLGAGMVAGIGAELINRDLPMIGASGAIAGVMGAYLVMFPGAMVRTLVFVVFFVTVIHLPAIILIGLWFLLQLYQGITSVGMDVGTAFWAHVGGLVVGALLTLLIRGRNYKAASPTVIRGY